MNLELYRLKSEHGTIIKVPVPIQNSDPAKAADVVSYYFRRMTLGEWIHLQESSDDPKSIRSLIDKLYLEVGENSQELKSTLFRELDNRPALARSIISPIEKASEFDDDEKIESYYNRSLNLAYSNAVLLLQMIMKAFPAYKIHDILDMSAAELLQTAAWAETYLEKPFFTEFTFFHDKYKEMYRHEFKDDDKEDFEYTYEMHIENKNFILNGEKIKTKRDEFFTDDNGIMRRGDPEEYRIKKAYFRENMKRKQANLPPISLAQYYTHIQSEGIDPTIAMGPPEDHASQVGDLTHEAAQSSSMHLKQRLEQEKQMIMHGKKPAKSFNWEEDKKSDITWDK